MPSAVACKLDNEETTPQFEPIPSYGYTLRHSCLPAFLAAERVYGYLDRRKDRPRTDRLRGCRTDAWFCRHIKTGEVRVASNSCHLRWCPICSQSKRNFIAHSAAEWTGHASYPKFLTLTIQHNESPLEYQIERLYNDFRELRRRKEFKRCIKGGIWFFQIKKSKKDGLWHPHLHCLVEGLYVNKRHLSALWHSVTGDSYIVDIRPVRDPQAAANDAAKYAACPGSLVDLSLEDACELVDSMHRRRICGTWGTGRAVSLSPPKQSDKDDWKYVGGWDIVMNTEHEDPNAKAIVTAWRDKQPLPEGIDCRKIDDFISKHERTLWETAELDEVYKPERIPP